MNRRMESVKLMAVLQPFTQLGRITASDAKLIVDSYKEGNTERLKVFVNDPTMPNNLSPLLDKVKQYI
ncbi:MAG: hypothetical protein J6M44_04330 [Butyrivibrio sp.]|uniref:hypothetical protein n=1 Tax=Butyrivibrio sp. TaxID=28121 RepID=UPI001B524C0D|nr:hypothetical protein [Butyrivibrio sp.]MBP3278167.1 hypothetical protein [Butyrivibrio sp.]MBP3782098.1 hypothetical protein [Butyrivibrio sp.]